jgi:hypothetical protein
MQRCKKKAFAHCAKALGGDLSRDRSWTNSSIPVVSVIRPLDSLAVLEVGEIGVP